MNRKPVTLVTLEDAVRRARREIQILENVDKLPNYPHIISFLGYLANYESKDVFFKLIDAVSKRDPFMRQETLCHNADVAWQSQYGFTTRTASKLLEESYSQP